jgi:AraC-like DNA-binding protein
MDRRVRLVLDILHTGWHREWCVEELAGQVGLRPSRLEHLFRANVQTTIRDFIRERRLIAAAERIVSSYERISVISYEVGFQDISNFNHAFRKRFGMSPREYRNAHDRL